MFSWSSLLRRWRRSRHRGHAGPSPQWGIVVVAALQIVWATAGLIAEPGFHFGEDAPTEVVLGVDFNGVHALSGYLLFGPAFFFALRPRWASSTRSPPRQR